MSPQLCRATVLLYKTGWLCSMLPTAVEPLLQIPWNEDTSVLTLYQPSYSSLFCGWFQQHHNYWLSKHVTTCNSKGIAKHQILYMSQPDGAEVDWCIHHHYPRICGGVKRLLLSFICSYNYSWCACFTELDTLHVCSRVKSAHLSVLFFFVPSEYQRIWSGYQWISLMEEAAPKQMQLGISAAQITQCQTI